MEASVLCGPCRTLFAGKAEPFAPTENHYYYHHPTYHSIKCSIEEKCQLCIDIWMAVMSSADGSKGIRWSSGLRVLFILKQNKQPMHSLDQSFDTILASPWETDMQAFVLKFDVFINSSILGSSKSSTGAGVRLKDTKSGAYLDRICCKVYSLIPNHRDDRKLSEIGRNSNSMASRLLISKWFQECLHNHPECNLQHGQRKNVVCPARLIDVGSHYDDKVRLHIIQDRSSFREQYITLSHRWGGSQQHARLTEDSVSDLVAGIELERLPKTFRDAVSITRQLGVRWLWIDSQCIKQDDEQDWLSEGSFMGTIYEYGVLNIAATAATDSDGGLFFERDPLQVLPLRTSLAWPCYQYSRLPSDGHLHLALLCVKQRIWTKEVTQEALNSRAWVLQERMLAPRGLHFSRSQIFWGCKRKRACETFPDMLKAPEDIGDTSEMRLIKFLDYARQSSVTEPSKLNNENCSSITGSLTRPCNPIYRSWYELVTRYVTYDMTRDSDGLVAISGIAKLVRQAVQDKYLAGLFESHLHIGLLWHAVSGLDLNISQGPQPRRLGSWHCKNSWRAPSWSWASVKGHITWERKLHDPSSTSHITPLIHLVESYVDACGDDDTGQLRDAWIKLKASVLPLAGQLNIEDPRDKHYHGPNARWMHFKIGRNRYHALARFDESAILTLLTRAGRPSGREITIEAMPVIILDYSDALEGKFEVKIHGLLLYSFGDHPTHTTGKSRVGYWSLLSTDIAVWKYFTDILLEGRQEEMILL